MGEKIRIYPSRWHHLKIDPIPMDDIESGAKKSEVRKDDRGFKVGDGISLTCSDGRTADLVITHIQRGYGLPDDIAVLSVSKTSKEGRAIAEIFRRVCDANGVSLDDVRSPSHLRELSWPRQDGMLACRRAGITLKAIAAFLRRDHTTIMHGVKAAQKREDDK